MKKVLMGLLLGILGSQAFGAGMVYRIPRDQNVLNTGGSTGGVNYNAVKFNGRIVGMCKTDAELADANLGYTSLGVGQGLDACKGLISAAGLGYSDSCIIPSLSNPVTSYAAMPGWMMLNDNSKRGGTKAQACMNWAQSLNRIPENDGDSSCKAWESGFTSFIVDYYVSTHICAHGGDLALVGSTMTCVNVPVGCPLPGFVRNSSGVCVVDGCQPN